MRKIITDIWTEGRAFGRPMVHSLSVELIRVVAGKRSLPESHIANKTKMHFEPKNQRAMGHNAHLNVQL